MKARPRLADLFSVDADLEPTTAGASPPACPSGDGGGGTSAGNSQHGGSQFSGSQHGARQPQPHRQQNGGITSPFQRQPGSLPMTRTLSRGLSAGRSGAATSPPQAQPTLANLMRHSFSRAGSLDSEGIGSVAEPRPTLEYSGKPHARLVKRCAEAITALERLQRPIACMQSGGEHQPPLPKAALKFAMGLAFVVQRKVGLLGGMNWGRGCIVTRLGDGTWSAPCFFRVRHCSLGLTFGAQRTTCCHVLQNDLQVAAFLQSRASVGVDAAISQDSDPFDRDAPEGGVTLLMHRHGVQRGSGKRPYRAMVTDGAIWDLSVRAGYTCIDGRFNRMLYGEDVSADEIVGGRVALPLEFVPLHEAIDIAASEAQLVRPTISKFGLARQRSLASSGSVANPLSRVSYRSDYSVTPNLEALVRSTKWDGPSCPMPRELAALAASSRASLTPADNGSDSSWANGGSGRRGDRGDWSASGGSIGGATATTQRTSLTDCSNPSSPCTTLMPPSVPGASSGGSLPASGLQKCPSGGGGRDGGEAGGGLFGAGSGFKLFGEVEVEFEEVNTYALQEEAEVEASRRPLEHAA